MRAADWLLEQPWAYRAWQRPFADQKLTVIDAIDVERAKRVLDVGCGPGTNAHRFAHTDYLGIDLNPRYIAEARSRRLGRFLVGDAADLDLYGEFDFILVNSLFHHLDDAHTDRCLSTLANHLAPTGNIHVLDLVLPETWGVATFLARRDRGHYPRHVQVWNELLARHFATEHFQPYAVRGLGLTLWNMVYFKGAIAR